jgi:RHH-type proline utilization regulon transcriptional repressor/proline dehydrogenase/delta 1-pyrroline-5-carboxylate dehydrogenase
VGPGAKAGGPNYVASLGHWISARERDVVQVINDASTRWRELSVGIDPTAVGAEENIFRLRRIQGTVVVRAASDVDDDDLAIARGVADVVGAEAEWSPPGESDDEFLARVTTTAPAKVRLLGSDDDRVLRTLHQSGVWVDATPVAADGYVELLRWTREQSVSRTLHRHGNVMTVDTPS